MFPRIARFLLLALMVLNGLLFISNIYVLGDPKGAIQMHDDLGSDASSFVANAKVINCFVTGLLYLAGAYGIWRKQRTLLLAGVAGFILFDGFYLYELARWAGSNSGVLIGFASFGSLSLLFGAVSWRDWRKLAAQSA